MSFAVDAATERFIRNLPKTETHLHIEGALPFEFLQRVAPEAYPQEPESWKDGFRFASFAEFESQLLTAAGHWYLTPERYHEAAVEVFERLQYRSNVYYVETSFASGMMQFHGIDARATAEAIKSAAPKGMEVRVFMGIHHDGYLDGTREWIEDSLNWEHLDGLDLHGTESTPLGDWAGDLWARARAAGKATKAHAGEFMGPGFVRRVVDELGVRRVQHGVRSVEDPDLPAYLSETGVTLDVCPISNVKLQVVPDFDSHPIGDLVRAGVRCTVSTDDPLVFGSTLQDEYQLLAARLGFDHAMLARVARAGFEIALVPESTRREWLAGFDQIVGDALGGGLRRV